MDLLETGDNEFPARLRHCHEFGLNVYFRGYVFAYGLKAYQQGSLCFSMLNHESCYSVLISKLLLVKVCMII
jgi:hypothetical protein